MIIPDDKLRQYIIGKKLLSDAAFDDVEAYAQNAEITLIDALLDKELLTEANLYQHLSALTKFPLVKLADLSITPKLLSVIPESIARQYHLIAFERLPTAVHLAMADPSITEIQDIIAKKVGIKVVAYLATRTDITNALQNYKLDVRQIFAKLIDADHIGTDQISEQISIAKIADLIIECAYQDRASDIHIEPEEKHSLIRFRLDGVLHDIAKLPKSMHERIISRIKILSRLKTDEHLSPQDGKMRVQLDEENLDIRVSIIPVADGEKAVLRLLSSRSRKFSLVDLGMSPKDLTRVTSAIKKSYGMILATGPTGSGKTTSIYSLLKILNSRDKNITTIEDPIEYRISGINQIHVNPRTNLNFANGLRSILRQDPNIIFVGEIRDNETASMAVNAALTGHLVLSTLHTNDAATAIPRFIDMKVEPFLVASTINVIIAQRLVRKICTKCRHEYFLPLSELKLSLPQEIIKKHFSGTTKIKFFRGNGCKHCHQTGYSGRIGVFEIIEVNNKIRQLITNRADSDTIISVAVSQGMTTMLDDGLSKCKSGDTTLEEVLRVTKIENI
ncbi:MAG: GspE/PulE family protein [Candidatus Shapirobacteria bacterium]|nr:GspE/PulE family protein [Candidatus Shapirobacteria bacterium]